MDPIPDDHPSVREFLEISTALKRTIEQDFADTHRIYEAKPDDPFARRLLVRGVTFYVEGQMAAIRENLLFYYHFLTDADLPDHPVISDLAEKLNLHLPIKDYLLLAGKSLQSLKRGDDTVRDEILCVEETIKLMFRLHGRVFDHSITPAKESEGWEALRDLKRKRNQLTHPKCVADLEVSHEQARQAIVVFLWIHSCLEKIREIESAKWSALCNEFLPKM